MPAVNNNADALTEVQEAFTQLEKYVNDYFKNLDVQTEINNKLDEMAASGQLSEIIALYIQSSAVLGYKTVADMKNATNLVDGSICKTISNTTVGDNGGRFYLVRTITSSDVVDEVNIITLSVSDTLIAQLINDDRFINLANQINNKIGDLNNLNTTLAFNKLLTVKGIGPKVASCILLFGYKRLDVFPIDTWVKQFVSSRYGVKDDFKTIENLAMNKYGKYSGLAIQYMYHYNRNINEEK